jgi:hypothetical protein
VRDSETSAESQSGHSGATSGSQEVDSSTTWLGDPIGDDPSAEGQCLEDAGEEAKVEWLKAMFPDIAGPDIAYRLRKCTGNITRAVDELLNLLFIDQNEPGGQSAIPKGIDGFTHLDGQGRGLKGKGKRRMRMSDSVRSSAAASMGTGASREPRNVWTSMADDIDFICTRTSLQAQHVRSMYDAQKKSLASTISSMASAESTKLDSPETLDPLSQVQLAALREDFPAIPASQLYGLLVMSGSIVPAAHELAAAMMSAPEPNSTENLEIIMKHASMDLPAEGDSDVLHPSPWNQVNHSNAKNLAIAKAAAGSTAFAQAGNAYRRAKSDHRMGGAAAYYADVGRDNVRAAKEMNTRAAESLVMSQSTSSMLDLHGVSVPDAVRIAKDQVSWWWHSLGDTKYAGGGGGPAREGYRVVTGMGRHSRGGAPKIGPAVSRMLVREGWKVTVGQGEILVTGKARRS